MAKAASHLSSGLAGHLRRIDQVRRKAENLHQGLQVRRHEIELIYAGLYLDVVVSFERFLESLFLGYLSGRLVRRKGIVPRVTFRSEAVARDVVLGGKSYVDWFPYPGETLRRANAFFRSGRPFSDLDKPEKRVLQEALYIRNAIAHRSRHSLRMFETEVLGSQALLSHEKTPTGYLRSMFRQNPAQTRFESFAVDLATISSKLAV